MRKLWVLIKKDICLCPEWLLLAVVLTLIMPGYIIRSIEIPSIFYEPILILCAICASNLFVSRICYIEDNQAVKFLLRSLPVTRKELIAARIFVATGITIAFILLAECLGLLLGGIITATTLLAGIGIGLGYESIYLFIYYKCGNQVAQYAPLASIGITIFVGWIIY